MKTIQWINIVKGITIIVVVLMHVNTSIYGTSHYDQIKNLFGDSWDIPVFFLIGGFFITPEKLKAVRTFLTRKFHTIYKKLIVYYLIFLCLHNLFIRIGLLSISQEYGGKHIVLFSFADFLKSVISSLLFMGREPYLGPLWFIYVMFMAFIGLAILAWATDRLTKGDSFRWHMSMGVVLGVLCTLSLFFTNSLGINIPRCNNVFSAAWLIYVGYLVRNVLHATFSNGPLAMLSLIALTALCLMGEHMALITNSYHDIVQMTVCGVSALYLLSYVSQHIEQTFAGRCIAYVGSKSYHIMALHLIGINLFAMTANSLFHTSYPIDILGSEASSLTETLVFTLAGTVMPLMIIVPLTHLQKLCSRKAS